jgi:hypothetical protein
MILLEQLLSEVEFRMYKTYVYVEFNPETDITTIAQLIRSVDKVAVVNNKSNKEDDRPRGLLLIKIITTKPALETFQEVQKAAMTAIPDLKKFQFSERHIEQSEI